MTFTRRTILRARTVFALLAILVASAVQAENLAIGGPRDAGQSESVSGPASGVTVPIEVPAAMNDSPQRITPRGETSATETIGRSNLPSAGSSLSALAVVVLLIFAAARLWKAHGPKLPGAVPQDAAEVLGRCRIEPRQSLYLIRLGSRILVVGSSGGELSALSEITDPVEVDLITGRCRANDSPSSPFSRLFAARQAGETADMQQPSAFPAAPLTGPDSGSSSRRSPEQQLAERFRRRGPVEETGRVA